MKTKLLLVPAALTAAVLGGCSSPPAGCTNNQGCPAGQTCNTATGVCVSADLLPPPMQDLFSSTDQGPSTDLNGSLDMATDMSMSPDLSSAPGDMTFNRYDWAHHYGATGANQAFNVAVDTNGDVVVVGVFYGTIDLGGGPLNSLGDSDIFVARYNASGTFLWAHSYGGTGTDLAYGVALDSTGAAIVTGAYQGTSNFGGSALPSYGGYDAFLAKYSVSGAPVWSQHFGGTTDDSGNSVAVDPSGAVAITGYFTGTANFGGTALNSNGGQDVYIARYSGAGAALWSRGAGGTSDDIGNRVAVDSNGNAVVVGAFQNSANFGTGALQSAGMSDIFVASYTSTGTPSWARGFGGAGNDTARGVTVDGTGAPIVFGEYSGAVSLGGGLLPAHAYDVFLAKFTSAGVPVWSNGFAANNLALSAVVSSNAAGTLAITGSFNDQLNLGGQMLSGGGIYVAKFNAGGTALWAQSFGNSQDVDEAGLGVALGTDGSVVSCGSYSGAVNFGGGALQSVGTSDVFIVKLSP